ncbi:hypothetical protein OU798_13995 [Prolixibacteraceae bacterium Z1-6]|uniref:Uncharacterized protein n=1 Tax=Draconibacterium aestuarii TaxID=2998507 RepID=A0A9X3FEY6_9BACT|nr:hypothetical protein [Prolixibacteraceae bacterium Z1-6]
MIQLTKISAFLLLITLIYSCEYNLTKENFVEIDPPSDMQYVDLQLLPEDDTISIFQETTLTYNLQTNGSTVLYGTITFQDKTWDFYSKSGSFTIDPKQFDAGIDTLKLAFYLNSGTGSIADLSGMEGYLLQMEWIVIADGRPAPTITPTKRINDDGLLVIEWPEYDLYNFASYEISSTSSNRSTNRIITDPSHNFYVDSFYVGGNFSVRVSCRLQNDHAWGEILRFYEEPPQPSVEEIGLDSLRVSWNKSAYKAKYRLTLKNSSTPLYFPSTEDTVCVIPQIGFGNWTNFQLCTKSQYEEDWADLSYACDITSYKEYYLGTRLIGANWPEFGYNFNDKVLYSNEYDHMKCFDIDTWSLIHSADVNQISYGGLYSCPTNSSKVAATTKDELYVFNDQKLENPTVITYKTYGAYSVDHFLLTDNDRVAIAYNNMYKLFDVNTQQLLLTLDISDYPVYSKWACITTSQNGKYMCIVTNNGLKMYDVGTGEFDEFFSDLRNYRSAYFNPIHPDRLYLTLNEKAGIEIRDPSSFTLIDEINIPAEMVIRNIDPETDNILVTDYKHLFVIDPGTHETLLKVPCDESKSWLYKNHLFTNTGYALDITNKIQ